MDAYIHTYTLKGKQFLAIEVRFVHVRSPYNEINAYIKSHRLLTTCLRKFEKQSNDAINSSKR